MKKYLLFIVASLSYLSVNAQRDDVVEQADGYV